MSDIRKICGVSNETPKVWFDSGKLKGYRDQSLPNKDRMIPKDCLETFLRENKFPLAIPDKPYDITILSKNAGFAQILTDGLPTNIFSTTTVSEVGQISKDSVAIIMDFDIGADVCTSVGGIYGKRPVTMIVLPADIELPNHGLPVPECTEIYKRPPDMQWMATHLRMYLAITEPGKKRGAKKKTVTA